MKEPFQSPYLKRPFIEHFEELMVRLRRSFVWIIFGTLVGYAFAGRAVHWLQLPLLAHMPEGGRIIFTTPFEKIWVYMRLSFILGIVAVFPLIGWEVGSFLAPGLRPIERRRIVYFILSFLVFFVAGILLGYRYSLPLILNAAVRFGGDTYEVPFLTLSSYINVCLGILLCSALMLEIPVIMAYLSGWGWVNSSVWKKGRRISIVVNAVVSAFLSPPDAMSMLIMMVPLQLLYESGIWGARMAEWLFYERAPSQEIPEVR